MTRDEWKSFEKIKNDSKVILAMEARCEEQGHQWDCGADFMPLPRVFRICRWCGKRS